LKRIAKCLRALFFVNGECLQRVSVKDFVAAIHQGHAESCES